MEDIITINASGRIFQVKRSMLTLFQDSALGKMFAVDSPFAPCDSKTEPVFLDVDPNCFADVLCYLRHGTLVVGPQSTLEGVRLIADMYALDGLREICDEMIIMQRPSRGKYIALGGSVGLRKCIAWNGTPGTSGQKLGKDNKSIHIHKAGLYKIEISLQAAVTHSRQHKFTMAVLVNEPEGSICRHSSKLFIFRPFKHQEVIIHMKLNAGDNVSVTNIGANKGSDFLQLSQDPIASVLTITQIQ